MAVPQIFLTPCCYRPICSRCIAANQRLQRYDPCLACLGGVGVVRSGSGTPAHQVREKVSSVNVDGAVRDEDTFVLGDADDDEEDDVLSDTLPIEQPERSHPAREGAHETASTASILALTTEQPTEQPTNTTPLKYYITRNDTLQGIALRYGLNGHELCRLNNLPPSSLRTTPHLLHTRRYLTLPPSARQLSGSASNENSEEVKERQVRIQLEKAEKRLQTLTKEVDWHIAKAYVALEDDAEETGEYDRKLKEGGLPNRFPSNLEERAIAKYLDDDEWEANARKDGGKVGVTGLPFVHGWGNSENRTVQSEKEVHGRHERHWWQR